MTCTIATITTVLAGADRSLSAHELGRALFCAPGKVCAEIENAIGGWWSIQKIAGPDGFLYSMRPVVCARSKMKREVKEYSNSPTIGKYQTT